MKIRPCSPCTPLLIGMYTPECPTQVHNPILVNLYGLVHSVDELVYNYVCVVTIVQEHNTCVCEPGDIGTELSSCSAVPYWNYVAVL